MSPSKMSNLLTDVSKESIRITSAIEDMDSTSIADKEDPIRERRKSLTDSFHCFGEALSKEEPSTDFNLPDSETKINICSKDSASETERWAKNPLVKIFVNNFSKEGPSTRNRKKLRELRTQKYKQITKLAAKNGRLREEKAKIKEMEALPQAKRRQNGISASKFERCGNGSNMDLLINSPSSSSPFMPYLEELTMSESSNQNGEKSFDDDEQVRIFFEQCAGNVKRRLKYGDFNGLEEELNKVGRNVLPPFLSLIAEKIKAKYGDITENSIQSNNAAYPTCIMFYAAMKEMDELKELKDVSITKLRVWADAILDALQIKFNVQFAKVHLMKIASAYFGLKASDAKLYEPRRNLSAEVNVWANNLQVREESG
ncbi:hypothetical protein REPUB_Repub08aG0216300 [Reevesia pubescens]